MEEGFLQRLIKTLIRAGDELGVACSCLDAEGIAVLVYRTMSYSARQFHTLDHVFGFLDGADAVTTLAAIFHDLVYRDVDGGVPPELDELLSAYAVFPDSGPPVLKVDAAKGSWESALCLALFGEEFRPGEKLAKGANEFLSALAMALLLKDKLPAKVIAAVAACIEATIPFRGPDGAGRSPAEALRIGLGNAARTGLLDATADELDGMVFRAVAFANADVRDFKLEDTVRFLSNTWKLLPELNEALRQPGTYSVVQYRVALDKMRRFFLALPRDRIFHSFRGTPAEEELAGFRRRAATNLERGVAYLEAKLLVIAVLEAIAKLTGGDAPVALFLGDLPTPGRPTESLMEYLPGKPEASAKDLADPVYRLLKDGRLDDTSFDLKNSPLALYLRSRLPAEGQAAAVAAMDEYFAGKRSDAEFLSTFPGSLKSELYAACARMVPSRAQALERCADETGATLPFPEEPGACG